jgi:hypothetical protein
MVVLQENLSTANSLMMLPVPTRLYKLTYNYILLSLHSDDTATFLKIFFILQVAWNRNLEK